MPPGLDTELEVVQQGRYNHDFLSSWSKLQEKERLRAAATASWKMRVFQLLITQLYQASIMLLFFDLLPQESPVRLKISLMSGEALLSQVSRWCYLGHVNQMQRFLN